MAIAQGIEPSETLVVTEHAVTIAPLAGESENLNHSASFSSALCSRDNRKGNADARAWLRQRVYSNSFIYLEIAASM
jgi:hypothetical protein